jgi:hypothetical protein
MGVGDIRYTVLQVVQEVFRKLGLDAPGALSNNKLSIQTVDFINDVCNDLSDFGNWMETLVTANVTAQHGIRDYLITTSANVKNIGDIYFNQRSGAMRNVTVEEMRILSQNSANGLPSQYTIFGTDTSSGNPNLRFNPIPVSGQGHGGIFSILYFVRPPLYTTADGATIIPFPARVVVLGTLAKNLLNESGGAPTDRYSQTYQDYLLARKEALNRFKGDTGWNTSFRPSQRWRRC